MRRLIPINTKLFKSKIPILKDAIERRRKELKKCKYGQVERSLWLMSEIEHLTKLLEFNIGLRNKN